MSYQYIHQLSTIANSFSYRFNNNCTASERRLFKYNVENLITPSDETYTKHVEDFNYSGLNLMLASEKVLAKEWLLEEEEEAWKDL